MDEPFFVRDFAVTALIFGVAAFAWCGWGQEDPPRAWRPILGIGSVLGMIIAIGGGFLTWQNWSAETALALGNGFRTFGIICGIEVALCGIGSAILAITRRTRWISTWIALVVGAHFIPLAFIFNDAGLFGLAAAMMITTGISVYLHVRTGVTPSAVVGLGCGVSLLLFAARAAIIVLAA